MMFDVFDTAPLSDLLPYKEMCLVLRSKSQRLLVPVVPVPGARAYLLSLLP